jgi:hypothetical protein
MDLHMWKDNLVKYFSWKLIAISDFLQRSWDWIVALDKWIKILVVCFTILAGISVLDYWLIYWYWSLSSEFYKVLFYLSSVATITISEYLIIVIYHANKSRNDFIKLFSWEYPLWILPLAYSFFLTMVIIPNITLLVAVGICTLILLYLFFVSLTRYLSRTHFGKKRTTFPITTLILFMIFFTFSCISDDNLILFWPFISLLIFFRYTNYLRVENNTPHKSQFFTEFVHDFRKSYNYSQILMLFVLFLFLLNLKGLWPFSNTISSLFSISITIYTFILSVTVASIGLVIKGKANKKKMAYLRRAFLGFAEMCIMFILVSLVGIILGLDSCNITNFLKGQGLITTLSSGDIITNTKTLLQILVLETILISFPHTLLYLYAMIKQVMKSL